MKNSFFIILIWGLLSLFGWYQEAGYYRVTCIKDKGELYIIHAISGGKRYLIVSNKRPSPTNGNKIAIGKTYYLKLSRILPMDTVDGKPVMANLGVNKIIVCGKTVTTKRRFHNSVYIADNLQGLVIHNDP